MDISHIRDALSIYYYQMKIILTITLFILLSFGLQIHASDAPVEKRNQLTEIAKDDGAYDGCTYAGRLWTSETQLGYNLICGMALKMMIFDAEFMTYNLTRLTTDIGWYMVELD